MKDREQAMKDLNRERLLLNAVPWDARRREVAGRKLSTALTALTASVLGSGIGTGEELRG